MEERRRVCPAPRSAVPIPSYIQVVFRHSMTFLLTSECHLHVFQKDKHLSWPVLAAAFESAARD